MADRFLLSEAELLDLVGDIYDCAIEPTGWPRALERLAGLVDAKNVAVTLNSRTRPQFTMRAQWNVDPGFEAAMLANYSINPLLYTLWYLSVDEVFSVLSKLDEAELKSTQWYKNTMGAYGLRDSAVSLLAKSVSQFGSLSFQRSIEKPPFDSGDLDLIGRLAPHIRRAVMIGDLLEARALEHDMLSATLEMLTVGVVLTDGTGRSVHANGAASRYLEEGAALYRDQGLIMARDPVAARELAQAIATAASGTTLDIPRAGLVVPLRASRGHDLAAWVLPLDKGMRGDLGADFAAQVAIFLREIGDTSPLPGELFVRRYAITPAECRILMLIVQGMTPQEAAEATGISVNTAKTHIARLFEKTGTQRQAELVRLAMTALAPAQREAPE